MATFDTPKDLADIAEPVLIEEDWVKMRIVDEPKLLPGKKKRENPNDPGARDNIVLNLRAQTDDEFTHGRQFTAYVTMPNASDRELINSNGQTMEDFLLESAARVMSAFAGQEIKAGSTLSFEAGQEAFYYMTKGPSYRDESVLGNQIDINKPPKPVV